MRIPGLILFTLLLAVAATAGAQTLDTDNPRSHREVLAMGLYPPDLIMRHQQRLGITDAQRDEMLKQVRAFQDDVADLQWNLQNEQQLLRQALAQDRIEPETAMPIPDNPAATTGLITCRNTVCSSACLITTTVTPPDSVRATIH